MRQFAALLDQLYFTYSNNEKLALLVNYFRSAKDPDRGYALAAISGGLKFRFFKSGLISELIKEYIDPALFKLSYDYVGDLSETVALLWPEQPATVGDSLPSLTELIRIFQSNDKNQIKEDLRNILNHCSATERWAILKLGTGSLRIGVSARFVKNALAEFGEKDIQDVEKVWHAIPPPYETLFAWLENKIPKPDTTNQLYFHPLMLSHPLDDKDLAKINAEEFFAEWKYDGIRVQLVTTERGAILYSRSGDDISTSFPEITASLVNNNIVLDGELVIMRDGDIASFNDLQQRLNRKAPSKKLMSESPAHIILYDILSINYEETVGQTLQERRRILEAWYASSKPALMSLSNLLAFNSTEDLHALQAQVTLSPHVAIEGLMLKRKNSVYVPGRPTGLWYKWKRDPFLIDAVLMYAQRGHGKRSSFYSDYTFGIWLQDVLVTIGKAYFGFTDEELKQLDKWVRSHTVQKFGPVREVAKELVLEIAFDSIQKSARHKSGYALRFPRINRIRWDKPAQEADTIENIIKLAEGG